MGTVGHELTKHPFSIIKMAALHVETTEAVKMRWIENDSWDVLEHGLRLAAPTVPPICIEFDNFDRFPVENPSVAAEAQVGLAAYLDDYSKAPIPGATIRAVVDAHAYRFAHIHGDATVVDSAAKCEIVWTKQSIRAFVLARISEAVGEEVQDLRHLVAGDLIHIPERGTDEDPLEYLMRHGSLAPGDLEHQMSLLIADWSATRSPLKPEDFRGAVADNSIHLAETRIRHAAEEVAALAASHDANRDFSTPFNRAPIERAIKGGIVAVHSETFGKRKFNKNFLGEWSLPEERSHLLHILWANRIVLVAPILGRNWLTPKSLSCHIRTTDTRFAFNPIIHDLLHLRELARQEVTVDYR